MSETEIKETEQNIEPENIPEPDDKETLEVDTTDMPDSSGNKPDDGEGVVRKAMRGLKSFRNALGFQKEPEPEETGEEDIPDEFTEAALAYGMSEKDIEEFASDYTDDELKEMIPFLLEEEEKLEPEEKPSATKEETPNLQQTNLPKEGIDALKEEIRKEFQGEIKELKEKLSEVDKTREAQENQVMMDTINQAFDEAGKEFEVFGQTKKLPVFPAGPKKGQYVPTSKELKARDEVFEKAIPFIEKGVPVKEAMETALTWYKGKYLTSDVKKNLIKDLKKSEKKLSAKRTSKETVPTYEDEDERKEAFVRQEAEKLGIKLSEEG